jgi:uncharacterized protein
MTTDEPLQRLLAVQDLDTEIAQLRHRRDTLAERREATDLARRRRALGVERQRLDDDARGLGDRQQHIEDLIANGAKRQETLESRMYASRGAARDLEAMAAEVDHLRARRRELEDEELEVMEQQESLERELAPVRAELDELDERWSSVSANLARAQTEIDAELEKREAARRSQAAQLPSELSALYERLRERLGGTGAARLVGGRCSGCHLSLPAMEIERIRHLPPDAVVTCEQCGRILVRPDENDPFPTSAP